MLQQLLTSKKFIAMIAGVLLAIANGIAKKAHLDIQLDPDTVNWVLTLVGAYIVAQGVADHGKEAAKVEAAASSTASVP